MKKIRTQDLLEKVDSQFKLVTLAAKRVKSLSHGAQPLLKKKKSNLIEVALEEIAEGKITYQNESSKK
jgi:DNA-directed RNA polymerase subunit omega